MGRFAAQDHQDRRAGSPATWLRGIQPGEPQLLRARYVQHQSGRLERQLRRDLPVAGLHAEHSAAADPSALQVQLVNDPGMHSRLGRLALPLLLAGLLRGADDAAELYRQAVRLLSEHHTEAAAGLLERSVALRPADAATWAALGVARA